MDKMLVITVCPVPAPISRKWNPNQRARPRRSPTRLSPAAGKGRRQRNSIRETSMTIGSLPPDCSKETIDRILHQCPDITIQPGSCEGYLPDVDRHTYESVKPMVEALGEINLRYMESPSSLRFAIDFGSWTSRSTSPRQLGTTRSEPYPSFSKTESSASPCATTGRES